MKRIIIAAFAVLAIAACQKNSLVENTEGHLSLNLTINGLDTKAVKTAWETGDIIIAVFDTDISDKHLELSYNGTSWDPLWSAGLEADLIARGSGKVSAVFVPNAVSYGQEEDGVSVIYKPKDSKGNTIYSYSLKTDGASYSISGVVLTATLNMTLNTNEGKQTHFYIDGISGTDYTLHAELNELWQSAFGRFYDYSNDYLTVLGGVYTFTIPGYPISTGVEFSAIPSHAGTTIHYVFTLTNTTTGNSYQYDAGVKTLNGGEAIKLPTFDGEAATPVNWKKQ